MSGKQAFIVFSYTVFILTIFGAIATYRSLAGVEGYTLGLAFAVMPAVLFILVPVCVVIGVTGSNLLSRTAKKGEDIRHIKDAMTLGLISPVAFLLLTPFLLSLSRY